MSELVTEINKLGLDYLDNGWVQAIYHSEFLEFGDLPADYENSELLDIQSVFRNIMKATDLWLSQAAQTAEERSWSFLSHQIDHEKVLAILAYSIDYGRRNVHTKEYRNNALLASRVYYKLLSIPGHKAYHIYHSQLLVHSLSCLSFPKAMCDNDNNYYNTKELTREVNSVIKELSKFAKNLKDIIENLQLNPQDMNFEDILSNLVDITGGAIVNKLDVDKIELTNLSGVIYEIINNLICNSDGQPNSLAIRLLFKCLLPKLLAASLETKNANNIVRASYVTYAGLLLNKYGKSALEGYMLLLQHMCYSQDGLERQEVRNARVSLVSGLMSLLPRQSYRKTVTWLLQLSTTSRVAHRQIAMELLANLLSNDPEVPIPAAPPVAAANASDSGVSSFGMDVEQHSNDTNGTIEAHSGTANVEESENNNEQSERQNIATDDDSSQDSQVPPVERDEVMEDIMAGLLRQRPHTVRHADILRAVHARLFDVSSTLRTRALAILADCVSNTRPAIVQAIKELNGEDSASQLRVVAVRSACDERAVVRRAGATLVHKLLSAPDLASQDTDLIILVNLCRDASILVRTTAISALGDLAINHPSEVVLDAFLLGPMHQLSDPEIKVQDQVVAFIQQLLIDRLHVFTGPDSSNTVPWMFLQGIARRNMKKHLQKACIIMTKAGSINHRIIDILSTHLGVLDDARDLHCLVLLTCVARQVEYSNVGFVLNYYYKIADNEKLRDMRLMSLTLELIMTWSMYVQSCERTALREHLVRRLLAAKDDGCRIACATLAGRLDPSNLSWSTEIMQFAERRAIENVDMDEAIRAADLSLVAPVPPSEDLLYLFLLALSQPPSDWTAAQRGACVAGAGRLCVRAQPFAALLAPALAALLPDHAVPMQARVNALLALTDICIRYTSIVEPLLGSLCGCLSRESPTELRQATARALTKLLLGGFLRLRAPLYYRYFALLSDDDREVREPAEYYVTRCLSTDTIYHHFVDCVIHYNKDYKEPLPFDARQSIYDVMLQRFSIVQKLNVQCRLARDVLQHAADMTDEGDEELSPELNATLLDTITLLCSSRMKLPRKPQNTGDPADIDDLQERVTTNIVSHKMKRTVAEVLVPAVLRLYARLAPRGGQLATYLVRIATDLLDDYRQEIEELIDSDEEIVERINYFQQNIGQAPTFRTTRNLVTSSAPPEPETPKAARRRTRPPTWHNPRKRTLKI